MVMIRASREMIEECKDLEMLREVALDLYDRMFRRFKVVHSIPIKCMNNGITYDSIRHAARSLDLCEQSVRKVIRGEYSQTAGYTFVKIE